MSDIEAEFCNPTFLSSFTGEQIETCETWITELLAQNSAPIGEQFAAQRTAHNSELHKAGGSRPNAEIWAEFQERPLKGAKGKMVFKQLKNKIPGNKFSETAVLDHSEYPELASTLKENLRDLLA